MPVNNVCPPKTNPPSYINDISHKHSSKDSTSQMEASGNAEVKLLGFWASPYVMRTRIALNIKEVQYEFLEESFGTKSELLLKSNPVYKKIPVLIHDGKPICESMIIVQYIDEVWTRAGTSLVPADPYERAMHRFWTVFVDDKVLKQSFELIFNCV
jgi:glutathione S-transferase